MDVSNARTWWHFDKKLETDQDLVECPKCKVYSLLVNWREGIVGCEDCGEHDAMVCPECDKYFDHVWGPTFKVVRNPEKEESRYRG